MYIASGTYNWADEMDIPYIIMLTETQYKNYLKFREKFPNFVVIHVCCGTNEIADVENLKILKFFYLLHYLIYQKIYLLNI